MKLEIDGVCQYNGHNIKPNGAVDLNLKFAYDEMVNVIAIQQMLNNDINIKVKFAEQKPFKLGMFRLANTQIMGDGESRVRFNGLADFVEVDNLNKLVFSEAKELFRVHMSAEIEIEDETEDDEDWD